MFRNKKNENITVYKIKDFSATVKKIALYWVPQNSRNNSMGQCQLMLENNEKNNKKILYLLNLNMGAQKVQL
jgi:hypothetical protein